jgi:hypothetical protein
MVHKRSRFADAAKSFGFGEEIVIQYESGTHRWSTASIDAEFNAYGFYKLWAASESTV